jgi:hypothetical protein
LCRTGAQKLGIKAALKLKVRVTSIASPLQTSNPSDNTDVVDRTTVRTVAIAINGVNRQGDPNGLDERLAATEDVAPVLTDAI